MKKPIQKIYFEDLDDSNTPVLNYCRKLVKENSNLELTLHCYRKGKPEPDVIVRDIRAAAELGVREEPYCRFQKYKPRLDFKVLAS